MKTTSLTALAIALALTAACSSRRPAQLPPPPGTGTEGTEAGADAADPNAAGNAAGVPGSQAHFLQNVPADRVLFDTDEFGLSPDDRSVLDAQAAYLEQYPSVTVTIEGHADERGTREYNQALGQRRANAARDGLVAGGVAGARIATISSGKDRPAALGSTEDAWAQNRRAVTVVR
jgi:peptidoglycan-associated lipoprotein